MFNFASHTRIIIPEISLLIEFFIKCVLKQKLRISFSIDNWLILVQTIIL